MTRISVDSCPTRTIDGVLKPVRLVETIDRPCPTPVSPILKNQFSRERERDLRVVGCGKWSRRVSRRVTIEKCPEEPRDLCSSALELSTVQIGREATELFDHAGLESRRQLVRRDVSRARRPCVFPFLKRQSFKQDYPGSTRPRCSCSRALAAAPFLPTSNDRSDLRFSLVFESGCRLVSSEDLLRVF